MYFQYLKYVLEHKKNVFKACRRRGLKLHALTHDLSKFTPSEFIPYARWFNGKYGVAIKDKLDGVSDEVRDKHMMLEQKFNNALLHHYQHNKHHWNYWCYSWKMYKIEPEDEPPVQCEFVTPLEMPTQYLVQMVCDWEAMAMKFGGSAQGYYLKNYYQIELNRKSRYELEGILNIYSKYFDYCHNYYHYTIGEIYNKLVRDGIDDTCFSSVKEVMDSYYDIENEKYKLSVYDCIHSSREKLYK